MATLSFPVRRHHVSDFDREFLAYFPGIRFLKTLDGIVLSVCLNCESVVGIFPTGHQMADFVPPDVAAEIRRLDRQAVRDGFAAGPVLVNGRIMDTWRCVVRRDGEAYILGGAIRVSAAPTV